MCILYIHAHSGHLSHWGSCIIDYFVLFPSDEGSARHYVGLAFSLALQLNTILLESCTKITELAPVSGLDRRVKDDDLNQDYSSLDKQSNTDLRASHQSSELNTLMSSFSLEESVTDSHGNRASLYPSESSGTPGEPSVSRETPNSQTTSESSTLDLANASAELLCVLDLLAIILPSVRVWLDWMRIHDKLWMCCVSLNIESSIMWVFISQMACVELWETHCCSVYLNSTTCTCIYTRRDKFWTSTFNFINRALDLFPRSSEHVHRIGTMYVCGST